MAVSSSAISSEPVTDWATLLCNSLLCNNGSLDFHPPQVSGSIKVVNISANDVSSTTNKWNCAAIAQFIGSDCLLDEVKKFAETKWNDLGLLEVHKLDNDLFIFRFQSEESKIKVLDEPLVFYGSKMMFLRPWVPNKPIQKLILRTVPIWIKLPGLGFQYFSLKALSKLGSLVGRPLFVDKGTADQSRLDYARLCVQVKADEKLPEEITFLNEFGAEIVQKVEYEWIPSRCTICKIFGHNTADTDLCTRKEMSDLKATQGDSHDMKSEQPGINADSEKVGPKTSSKDDKRSSEKKSLLPKKKVKDLTPETYNHMHTLTVKVVSSNIVYNRAATSTGSPSTRQCRRVAECLVGDETGTIVFTARNEQVDLMLPGATVLLRNAKMNLFKGNMRLAVDELGRVDVTEPANFAVKKDNNLSLVEYEQ